MPETLVDGQVKFLRLFLKGADPSVAGGGRFPEGPAKYREETGNPFQTGVPVMGGGTLYLPHIFLHELFSIQPTALQYSVDCDPRQDRALHKGAPGGGGLLRAG